MRFALHLHRIHAAAALRRYYLYHRWYATKYSGRVVVGTDNGRSFAVEVDTPTLQSDVRGYPLPRRHLICKAVQILQSPPSATSDPFLDLSDYLETLTLTITSSEASEILKALKSPNIALKFFQFCPTNIPKFRHDAFTYNRILLILSKSSLSNRLDIVRTVLDDMERSGTRGSISTVNILIGIFGDRECQDHTGVDELQRCLGLIKRWELKLNRYTYKCLLQAYLRLDDSNKAMDLYKEMRSRGYKLDIFAYNMLLDALAKHEKVDQANKVFEDMKQKHCEPDEYTYTIMIRMSGKIGKSDVSLSLFHEMLSRGCSPNLIAYNTMIQALAKSRLVDKAIFLFSKMVENNCRPNEFTYNILLNILVAEGQLGRLDEVVEISGKYMNKSIYAYLVRSLSKLGHASEAHRLFCNMWTFHDQGDRDAFLSMLQSLCDAKKTTEAIDLLNKMHEREIKTDTFMYNIIFPALGKLKQIGLLHDLYERMKKDGPSPDLFTYNILISSFGRAGEVHEAVRIFEELDSSNCTPDIVSYNSLINCLGKNGDVVEAHMRFREMQEKGLNPDVVTYSTLIECFGKSERVEMACRLFDEMLAAGCSPNIVTYNILLDCLEKCGRTAEAVDLYGKLKQQGLTPDYITYAVLERLQSGSLKPSKVRRKNPITGSLVLIGGDPGVGKSTLLLQIAAIIAEGHEMGESAPVVYISGEGSVEQIGNRADRMRINTEGLFLYSSTDVEDILEKSQLLSPRAIVVDSIQTVYLKGVAGSAGGIYQVKECTSALLRFAKKINIPILLIGHVTKSGDIAGPRVLEHIVDVVLYMEGEKYSSHRLLRSVKNRFGSTDELGVFEMSQSGLQPVTNPSEMFLREEHSDSEFLAGLAVSVIMDASRTFLVEIQALCVAGSSILRHVNGVQASRADMIISVLMKQAGLKLQENGIFLNVVSGVNLTETAGDLAVAAAICSSFLEFPIPSGTAFIGEVGLGGELRTVPRMEKRINTVVKLGYKKCIVPKSAEKSLSGIDLQGIQILGCRNLKEMINTVFRKS